MSHITIIKLFALLEVFMLFNFVSLSAVIHSARSGGAYEGIWALVWLVGLFVFLELTAKVVPEAA